MVGPNYFLRRGSRYAAAQGRKSGTVQRDFCKKAGVTMSSAKDTKFEDSKLCGSAAIYKHSYFRNGSA